MCVYVWETDRERDLEFDKYFKKRSRHLVSYSHKPSFHRLLWLKNVSFNLTNANISLLEEKVAENLSWEKWIDKDFSSQTKENNLGREPKKEDSKGEMEQCQEANT